MGIKSNIPSLNEQIVFGNSPKINVNMQKIDYSSSKNYNANKYMYGNGSSTSKSTTYNGEAPSIRKNFYSVKSEPLKFSLDGKETFSVADLMRGTTTTSDGKKVSLAGNEVITDLRNRIAKKHNPSNSGEWWKYTTDANFEKYLYEEIGLDPNDRTKILAEFKSQYSSQIENMTDAQIWEYIVYSKMQESYIIEQNMKEYNARAEKFENFENQLIRDVKINYIYQDYLGIEVKLDSEGNVTNSEEILDKYYEFIGHDKGTVCDVYSKLWNEAKTPAEKEQVFASACMYEFNCKMEEIDNKNFEDSLTRLDKFGRWGLKQRESFKSMKDSFKYAIESPDVTLVDGAALFFDKMADGYMSVGGEISCALGRFVVEDIMGEKYDAELWKETVAEQVNAVNEGNLADEIMNLRMKKDARFAVESDYINKYYAAREFGSNMYTMAATIAAPGAAGLSMSILESTGASYGIAVSEGASSTDAMDYATVRGITEGTTQYLLYRAMGSAGSTEVKIAGKTFSKYGFDLATNLGLAALDPVVDAVTKNVTYRDDVTLMELMKEEDTLGRSFTGVVSSYGFMKAGEFATWGITKVSRLNYKYKIAESPELRRRLGIPADLPSEQVMDRVNKIFKNVEHSDFETRSLDLETLKKLSDAVDGLDPSVQKEILGKMTGNKKANVNSEQYDSVMKKFVGSLTDDEMSKLSGSMKNMVDKYRNDSSTSLAQKIESNPGALEEIISSGEGILEIRDSDGNVVKVDQESIAKYKELNAKAEEMKKYYAEHGYEDLDVVIDYENEVVSVISNKAMNEEARKLVPEYVLVGANGEEIPMGKLDVNPINDMQGGINQSGINQGGATPAQGGTSSGNSSISSSIGSGNSSTGGPTNTSNVPDISEYFAWSEKYRGKKLESLFDELDEEIFANSPDINKIIDLKKQIEDACPLTFAESSTLDAGAFEGLTNMKKDTAKKIIRQVEFDGCTDENVIAAYNKIKSKTDLISDLKKFGIDDPSVLIANKYENQLRLASNNGSDEYKRASIIFVSTKDKGGCTTIGSFQSLVEEYKKITGVDYDVTKASNFYSNLAAERKKYFDDFVNNYNKNPGIRSERIQELKNKFIYSDENVFDLYNELNPGNGISEISEFKSKMTDSDFTFKYASTIDEFKNILKSKGVTFNSVTDENIFIRSVIENIEDGVLSERGIYDAIAKKLRDNNINVPSTFTLKDPINPSRIISSTSIGEVNSFGTNYGASDSYLSSTCNSNTKYGTIDWDGFTEHQVTAHAATGSQKINGGHCRNAYQQNGYTISSPISSAESPWGTIEKVSISKTQNGTQITSTKTLWPDGMTIPQIADIATYTIEHGSVTQLSGGDIQFELMYKNYSILVAASNVNGKLRIRTVFPKI